MLKYDIALLITAVLYTIVILSTFQLYSKAVQDWLVLLTHAFSIPMIIILRDTIWVFITVIIGVLCSISYHISIAFDVGQEYTGPLDISFSTLTLLLVTTLVLFEKFPEWLLPVLMFVVLLLGVFWDLFIVTNVIGGITILCQIIFVGKRTYDYYNNREDKKRKLLFIYISLLLGVGGIIAFLFHGHHSDPSYAVIHSIWHVCAYTAMYFGLRSIVGKDNETLRVPRVTFDINYNNIFAYD